MIKQNYVHECSFETNQDLIEDLKFMYRLHVKVLRVEQNVQSVYICI